VLKDRQDFGKKIENRGLKWFEHSMFFPARFGRPLSIAYAEVATHNHFVLDRGSKVFNRTAPVIKLPESASEDDHLALLAYLNSSTVCFWMKQACFNKGGSGMGRGIQDENWESRFAFNGTQLADCPVFRDRLIADALSPLAGTVSALGQRLESFMPRERLAHWCAKGAQPVSVELRTCKSLSSQTLARMCSLQEELDWLVYEAFGLLTDADRELLRRARGEALPGFPDKINPMETEVHTQGLHPGHRAFEVVLARDSLISGTPTAWFDRNNYASPGTIRDSYSPAYQRLIEARIAIIDRNPLIKIIEQPEYKHRWTVRDFDAELRQAGVAQLTSAAEAACSALAVASHGNELARGVLADAKLAEVAEATFPDSDDRGRSIRDSIQAESVPFLAALRFNDKGMEKYRVWQHTWDLQRKEDSGLVDVDVDVDDSSSSPNASASADVFSSTSTSTSTSTLRIPVPPKYDSKDFRDAAFWRLRGKLDVPKERFISYPGCESEEDGEPLYGWAGWNHLQRAQALATLYQSRKTEEGWGADRLTPMLAGLDELLPWVKQWHNEPDAEFGLRLGDYFESFLETECRALGLTRDDLRAWRPAEKTRGRRHQTSGRS
jgi:hypothetical protein